MDPDLLKACEGKDASDEPLDSWLERINDQLMQWPISDTTEPPFKPKHQRTEHE